MKNKMEISKTYYWMLPVLILFSITSCRKDNSMGFTPGTGVPTITSVRTLSKSVVDSSRTSSVTTYNSSGIATTVTNPNYSPLVTAFDSTTATGKLGNYYAILGTNLGSATSIAINGVSIYFNRALNSDKALIFSLPSTVPYTQPQSNAIVVTTLYGKVTYKFTTLPPPPTVTTVSDYDFTANSQITLTGKGFASVTAVKLKSTSDVVTILSQNDSTLVMKMPASTATESALLFTYTSGSNTGAQALSPVIFNDLDNAYVIFNKNSFQNSWADNSWSGPSGVSTNATFSGTATISANYPAGGWQVEGWANWYPSVDYNPDYKYLTFWVKGGTVPHTLVLVGDQMKGGYGQVQNTNAYAAQLVTVPAKVWTFFKIPLAPSQSSTNPGFLNFWANGSPAKQLGFFLQGMSGDVNETMYFDEVAFIK